MIQICEGGRGVVRLIVVMFFLHRCCVDGYVLIGIFLLFLCFVRFVIYPPFTPEKCSARKASLLGMLCEESIHHTREINDLIIMIHFPSLKMRIIIQLLLDAELSIADCGQKTPLHPQKPLMSRLKAWKVETVRSPIPSLPVASSLVTCECRRRRLVQWCPRKRKRGQRELGLDSINNPLRLALQLDTLMMMVRIGSTAYTEVKQLDFSGLHMSKHPHILMVWRSTELRCSDQQLCKSERCGVGYDSQSLPPRESVGSRVA